MCRNYWKYSSVIQNKISSPSCNIQMYNHIKLFILLYKCTTRNIKY